MIVLDICTGQTLHAGDNVKVNLLTINKRHIQVAVYGPSDAVVHIEDNGRLISHVVSPSKK